MLARVRKRLARSYRRHVHPALQETIRRARTRRSEQQSDLVSVIVPIYEVEEWLAECLNSVVGQTYRNLEIIVVDDGSPDGSHDIAASYARWDPRIRIIRQSNAGLGAARNTGVRDAHGKYLTFVDSDDTLPKNAIARMVRSLRRTKSDFVVGAPMRMANGQSWTSGWVKDVHAIDRERIRLDDFPDILKNVFAWSKLFDADFFRRVVGSFPEGIRYEDQEPTAKAYVAGTFDVLSATVYNWRDREDGTSITQQKSDPVDLHDRLLVKKAVADVIAAGGSQRTHEVWLAKAIGFDLRPYFEEVPRTDQDFFDQLRAGAQALEPRMTPEIWQQVRIIDRIPALALLEGVRDDVSIAMARREEYGWRLPGEVRQDGIYMRRSGLDELAIDPPDELLRLGDVDLLVRTKATALWWHGSILRLEGYAYLTNLPYDPETISTALELVSTSGSRVPLPVRPREYPRLDLEGKDAWNAHRRGGFVVDIDPNSLPLSSADSWHLEVTLTVGQAYRRTAQLRECDPRGIGGTRPVAPATGNARWMAGFEDDRGFELRRVTDAHSTAIVGLQTEGRGVRLSVDDAAASVLRLTCRTLHRTVEFSGVRDETTGHVTFTVSLPELLNTDDPSMEHVWSMRVHGGSGEPRRLTYPGNADELRADSPEHSQLRVVMTRAGTVRLAQNRWWAVADDLVIDDETITITGRISAPGASRPAGRLVSRDQVIRSEHAHMRLSRESFILRFPVSNAGHIPTTRHGFSVRMSVELAGRRQERWLRVADDLQTRFPLDRETVRHGITFTRTRKAAALWIRFRGRYTNEERGILAQRRLHDYFRRTTDAGGGLTAELHPAALFECASGGHISESTLAILAELRHRLPDLEVIWTVPDLGATVPEQTTAVLRHSKAYMSALHNARYIVNNSHFPFYYRKREGQIYIYNGGETDTDLSGAAKTLSQLQLLERETMYRDVVITDADPVAEVLDVALSRDNKLSSRREPQPTSISREPSWSLTGP